MDTRKVSAAAGFILLMGCIVGVIVVIYRGGSVRSSYKSTLEESWKKRETRMKEINELGPSTSEPSAQEAKLLAEELQRLFIKNPNPVRNIGSDDDNNSGKEKEATGPKNEKKSSTAKSLSASKIPSVVMNLPTLPNHPSSPEVGKPLRPPYDDDEENKARKVPGRKLVASLEKEITSHEESRVVEGERMEKKQFYETPWIPSISPRLQQIAHHHMTSSNRESKDRVPLPSLPSVHPPEGPPASRHPSVSMSTPIYSASAGTKLPDNVKRLRHDNPSQFSGGNKFTQSQWEDDALLEDDDDLFDDYDEQYLLETDSNRDPIKEMGQLFQLASSFYKTGINTTNLSGILQVINETVQRGNNSGLLTQLNELYSRPGIGSMSPFLPTDAGSTTATLGRNAYETSLTAFVFMSFGIFLLNQIHNFVGDEVGIDGIRQGRNFEWNTVEESDLDVLFQPPPNGNNESKNWTFGVNETETNKDLNESRTNGSLTNEHFPESTSPDVPDYVNNMFRAVLNLVNAYTKDTQALECIWSLYCQDLDKTAAKQSSLYSLAARINSIGLRLIMGQIPTELTPDVMLRSLLAWDGLPCTKYFPKCKVDDGTVSFQTKEAIFGNRTSLQMT